MLTTRRIFALLLMIAPMLCAQESATQQAAAPAATAQSSAHPKRARLSEHESFHITILFKRYRDEKRVTDRSYTLLATTGEVMPAMRDDERYRAGLSDDKDFLDHNIDVDILGFRRSGDLIYVALRISTKNFALDNTIGSAKLPVVADTHQYLVTPTIPIGKLITVYSASQPLNKHKEEVQLLVQTFDATQQPPE